MLYLIGYDRSTGIHRLFHSETNSFICGNSFKIKEFIKEYNEEPMNFIVDDIRLIPNGMPNGLYEKGATLGRTFIEAIIDGTICKVVTQNGRVRYITVKHARDIIDDNKSSNCIRHEDGKYELNHVRQYNIQDRICKVRELYKSFINKSKLLGIDNRFQYSLDEDNVILERFIGDNTRVSIPHFITSIGEQAFSECNIDKLSIPESVRYIGGRAFLDSHISNLEIPESVKFIGDQVFYRYRGNIPKHIKTNRNMSILDSNIREHIYNKESFNTPEFYSYFE